MQNYHKHSWFSNVLVSDCATNPKAYIDRALELGHKVISSVEHGFQSNYYDIYDLVVNHNDEIKKQYENGKITEQEYEAKKLKFVFGAEAYWVKDRLKEYPETYIDKKTGEEKVRYHKDRSNCHIILLAKNEEGRRDINEALSEANISGYYGQPRLDLELLLKIKPENVMVTTACLKYWVYEDIEEITLQLYDHFKENFFLEVQCHNTEIQKRINRKIIEMHRKYGIDIICGLDSHYIKEEDYVERNNYLDGRGMKYDDDEIAWYMDYPEDAVTKKRLQEQEVLTDEEIEHCMSTPDLILRFDDLFFDKKIKLPSAYPTKSQEWKDEKLRELAAKGWEREKVTKDPSKYTEYEAGIEYELSAIINTKMADYFLLDHKIVERGLEKGGIITKSGRGSGVSYYTNSLFGFSDIDRFISPVKLYPDRFMSETRILKTVSLPDLDLNLGNPEVFAEAQDEILTEAYGTPGHSYPMISYKPLQKSSAFKLYAKSQGLDFDIANDVTSEIKKYEKALKHADSPEEKETINIYDFVDKKYHKYLDESKKYQGIINAKSQAPCGYLIYGGDIKREIGLIRCVSGQGEKQHSVLTTVIDGAVAENYKFVKNDLLKVDIWLIINRIFDKIGIKTPSVTEMTRMVEGDEATWSIYANGITCGVNQCESDFGKQCCKRYKPQNLQELTALVAALRPGFKTQLDNFLDRKPYTTGVQALDDLLEDSFHYMMYQENIMTYLGWLGIDQTETYAIIKKISKKKFKDKELSELKGRLIKSWIENVGTEDGFEKTWEIIEAASKYSFNASHAFSYAYDSVYGAYCKAHYPYEFYATMLQAYTDKGDKDRVFDFKKEMEEAFGIREGEYKYRSDNRGFSIDKRNKCINPCLSSLKNFGSAIAEQLYEIRDYKCNSFVDLLLCMKEKTGIGMARIEDLIQIDYFSEFGNINTLLHVYKTFDRAYDTTNKRFKKQISKGDISAWGVTDELVKAFCHKESPKTYLMVDMYGMLKELESIDFKEIPLYEKASYQQAIMGKITVFDKSQKGLAIITDVDTKYSPYITSYALTKGESVEFKVSKQNFNREKLVEGDAIRIKNCGYKNKQKRLPNGEYEEIPNEKVLWVTDYQIIHKSKLRKKGDR